jgi:hypothetical protein
MEADGSFPIGAKEAWLERVEFLSMDLTWLLELKQFRYAMLMKFAPKTNKQTNSVALSPQANYTD